MGLCASANTISAASVQLHLRIDSNIAIEDPNAKKSVGNGSRKSGSNLKGVLPKSEVFKTK